MDININIATDILCLLTQLYAADVLLDLFLIWFFE
jgi:hypothetical protein